MASGKRRTVLRILAFVLLGLLVLVVALPLWFPWLLRPAAKRLGASYARYEREGYARFRLSDFSLTNSSGRLRAKTAEALVPTVWLWRRYFGPKSEPFLQAASWSWEPVDSKQRSPAPSAYEDFQRVTTTAATLRTWLPRADFTNGTLHLNNQTVRIPDATWTAGKLSAVVVPSTNQLSLSLSATAQPNVPITIQVDSEGLNLRAAATLEEQNRGFQMEGSVTWLTNQFQFSAQFSAQGALPETASVRADSFELPARLLRLSGYKDLTGSLRAEWRTNRYEVNLAAKAAPQAGNLPPLEMQLRASGDTNSAQIDVANISAPWIQAELPGKTEILFHPPFLLQPVTLRVNADLGRQPWFAGTRGLLTGEAVLRPNARRFPAVEFQVSGSDVVVSNVAARTLRLAGNFLWPQLELTQAQLEMADGSQAAVAGGFNVQDKSVHNGRLSFSGAFGKQFLPSGMSYRTAALTARFDGPLNTLTNSGKLEVEGLQAPRAAPLRIDATWAGRGRAVRNADVTLAAGSSSLHFRGVVDVNGEEKKLEFATLDLVTSNRTELRLQQPFQVTARLAATNASGKSWALDVQPMRWSGTNQEMQLAASVDWPERGAFSGTARGISTDLVRDFIEPALPDAELESMKFAGGWTNGPVAFQLETRLKATTEEQVAFTADATAHGGADGISIEQFSVSSATQLVFRAQASLPLSLDPAKSGGWTSINPNGPLRAKITTEPDSILWNKIASTTGLLLDRPDLSADLDGTWDAPRGHITMSARQIRFSRSAHPLPAATNIQVAAELTPDSIQISRLSGMVEGQAIEVTGQLPLGKAYWKGLRQKKYLPDWRTATGHLKIQDAKLAAFTSFLPEILSPEGSLRADVALEQGGTLQGELVIDGARTRPLQDVGPVRKIQACAVFAGKTLRLTNASAEIGGQPVAVEGGADLSGYLTQHPPALPPFHVRLSGTNVPLVRQPSLLLRADLDLAATNSSRETPGITGRVKLRHSLFLADLQTLVPERTASAKKRPPYFSVEQKPWADWRLNVEVSGDGFMRVQTPIFSGKVSTTMKVEGTLKDPMALGEVRIDSGSVSFPFGSLDVKQGLVSLTSANPYQPQLYVTAGVQRFGYDIKMEVTGSADAPIVQFSSTPPLNSEEIVMMLTTGKIPQGIGITSTTQQRAQGLAIFLGKNILSDFGLGGGSENRLTIRSGERISEAGRPTYELDYKINDRWSIVGEYDRFDQYNLNLKWKAYSK